MKTFTHLDYEIKIGDKVIFGKVPTIQELGNWPNSWPRKMNIFVDRRLEVVEINEDTDTIVVRETHFVFPLHLARRVE